MGVHRAVQIALVRHCMHMHLRFSLADLPQQILAAFVFAGLSALSLVLQRSIKDRCARMAALRLTEIHRVLRVVARRGAAPAVALVV